MNNEEIKQMIRELSDSADAEGRVKSRTIRIRLDAEDGSAQTKRGGFRLPWSSSSGADEETLEQEAQALPADESVQKADEPDAVPGEKTLNTEISDEEILDDDFLDEEDETDDMLSFSILPSKDREEPRRFRRVSLPGTEPADQAGKTSAETSAEQQVQQPMLSAQQESAADTQQEPSGENAAEAKAQAGAADMSLDDNVSGGESIENNAKKTRQSPAAALLESIRARIAILNESRLDARAARKAKKAQQAQPDVYDEETARTQGDDPEEDFDFGELTEAGSTLQQAEGNSALQSAEETGDAQKIESSEPAARKKQEHSAGEMPESAAEELPLTRDNDAEEAPDNGEAEGASDKETDGASPAQNVEPMDDDVSARLNGEALDSQASGSSIPDSEAKESTGVFSALRSKLRKTKAKAPRSEEQEAEAEVPVSKAQEAEAEVPGSKAQEAEAEVPGSKAQEAKAEVPGSKAQEAKAEVPGSKAQEAEAEVLGSKVQKAEASRREKPENWLTAYRLTPVEKADFASDAQAFRSARADEDEQSVSMRERFDAWRERMAQRGIGKVQLIVLAVLAAVLVIALVAGLLIWSSNRKTVGVTADKGLKVTIEQQPADWTSSGTVTLGIRTSSQIQSITVNETDVLFAGTNSTKIQVEADTEQLNLVVYTQDGVYTAVVDIARIDVSAPTVTLSVEDGLVTIDAQDERSGVSAVYYGVLTGLSTVPAYELYTEPFAVQEDVLYVYYAADRAGNVAGPVQTDMSSASQITLESSALALFPGDTYRLNIGTVPENAFLNGLQITSSDPSVASVTDSGLITAMADGTAQITVSADGVEAAVCAVTVRSNASVTISAVGDVTLGDDINFSTINSFSTVYSLKGSSYFFENVRSIFEADDITFANLEGTLTDQGERVDKTYAFRGDPSYTQILLDGSVEAVTLANNHSSDYGEISLTDTEANLTEAGIDYVIADTVVVREAAGVKVGLIGIYTLNCTVAEADALVQQDIDAVRRLDADVIVVAFHWGEEKAETPNDDQISLAHAAVDYGADLVVGHHPHVLQGIEVYEGTYIVYSLGNFCFGGNSNPSDKDTMIFQETFTLQRNGGVESTQVKVIPCSISSESSSNNYQPTPATGSEAERIMEKINERSAIFGTETFTYEE